MSSLEDLTLPLAPDAGWRQVNVRVFDEYTGAARLATVMGRAEADGLINAWFFVRKGHWRLRFQPVGADAAEGAHQAVLAEFADIHGPGDVSDARGVAYEPETHAFGGPHGMNATHRLWHADSRHLVTYLAGLAAPDARVDRRTETSVLLLSAMLRAAPLDWYEQGDVWALAATELRPLDGNPDPEHFERLTGQMRRFMTTHPSPERLVTGGQLAYAGPWLAAFADAGRTLAQHADRDELTRGLRRVLGQQFIFHWNRLGLPAKQQAMLCAAGRAVVLGDD